MGWVCRGVSSCRLVLRSVPRRQQVRVPWCLLRFKGRLFDHMMPSGIGDTPRCHLLRCMAAPTELGRVSVLDGSIHHMTTASTLRMDGQPSRDVTGMVSDHEAQ